MGDQPQARDGRKLPEAFVKRYLPSKLTDPLTYSYAEGLYALGEAWPANIVAGVPEELFRPPYDTAPPITVRRYLGQISTMVLPLTLEDGWIMGSISTSQRARQADRTVVARWASDALVHKTPTISEQIAQAANPRVAESPLLAAAVDVFWPESPFKAENLPSNRIFGLLGRDAQDAIFAGRDVRVADLPSSSAEALADEVYFGTLRELKVTDPDRSHDNVMPNGTRIPNELPALSTFDGEPTELMPNGLPRDAVIGGYRISNQLGATRGGQSEPWALFKLKEEENVYWKRTAQRIAFMLGGYDSVPIAGLEGKMFGYGHMASGAVNVQFSTSVLARFSINLFDVDLSKPSSLQEAPRDFLSELNKWIEYYKQNPPPPTQLPR